MQHIGSCALHFRKKCTNRTTLRRNNPVRVVTIHPVGQVFGKAYISLPVYLSLRVRNTAINAFRRTGICPALVTETFSVSQTSHQRKSQTSRSRVRPGREPRSSGSRVRTRQEQRSSSSEQQDRARLGREPRSSRNRTQPGLELWSSRSRSRSGLEQRSSRSRARLRIYEVWPWLAPC